MENNNANNQPIDQQTGGPLEGLSPQNVNMPKNNNEEEAVVYSDLGLDGQPDSMNPGDDEAADSLLYTDTATARHATDEVSNGEDLDDLPEDLLNEDLSDDELDREISELAEDEDESGEPY